MKYVTLPLLVLCTCLFLNAQEVSTYLAAGSGIDDCLFFTAKGGLMGSGFSNGNLYTVHPGSAALYSDECETANGIAEDSEGNLYVCDFNRNRVLKFDSLGNFSVFTTLTSPSGIIKMWGSDTMLVTSYTQDYIVKVAPDGIKRTFLYRGLINGPVGMVYDPNGTLFISNFEDARVLYVTGADSVVELCQLPGINLGFITYAANFLYATVMSQHKIYRINPQSGGFEVFAGSVNGSQDGSVATATFTGPNGIVANPTQDTLFVSEFPSDRVRAITGFRPPSTAIAELPKDWRLDISPNPSRGPIRLHVHAEKRLDLKVSIMDRSGRLVYQEAEFLSLNPGQNTHELNRVLPTGIYFVSLSDGQQVLTKKLLIH